MNVTTCPNVQLAFVLKYVRVILLWSTDNTKIRWYFWKTEFTKKQAFVSFVTTSPILPYIKNIY